MKRGKKRLINAIGIIIFGYLICFLCIFFGQSNETDTINWVDHAKKPITCKEVKKVDKNNEIYWTYNLNSFSTIDLVDDLNIYTPKMIKTIININ